jgi:glycosyltransferase involved in cell wall biosynthesis
VNVLHWYSNLLHGGGVASAVAGVAAAQARQGASVMVTAAKADRHPLYEPIALQAGVDLFAWSPTSAVRVGTQNLRVMARRDIAHLRNARPDVVHVHGEFNVDNLWVPRLFSCPVVVSPHGAFHSVVLRKSRRLAKQLYLATEARLAKRRVAAFHALTPMECEHTTALFPHAEVYCAPQGASPSFRPWPHDAPEPSPRKATITFASVGRLDVFTKGLDILLEAFSCVVTQTSLHDLRLVIVGPDWKQGRAWLERRARELDITDRVRFTGPLASSDVAAVLAEADVYIQLSRHEGFPLSVVEALVSTMPAILSDAIGTVSYPEIADLPHVIVVPPSAVEAARAIAGAVNRLPELAGAALRCHDRVRSFFSWDRAAAMHLEEYARLCRVSRADGIGV